MKRKIAIYLMIIIALYALFYVCPIYNEKVNPIFNSSNKLWAHRVLNSDDANKLSEDFLGIEIDLYYNTDNNIFDIRHHGEFQNKSFKEFLSRISKKDLYFWLDLKNLNENNVENIIQRLKELSKNNDLNDFMIIESKEVELLYQLKNKGFKISYWLPSFNILKSIYSVFEVKHNLQKYQPDAISCSYQSVDFYSKKFPQYNLHCWTNELVSEADKDVINAIVLRKNVKVVLTDFKYNFQKAKQ